MQTSTSEGTDKAGPTEERADARCAGCGHWDQGASYGMDHNTGFCLRWEKLTDRGFGCDAYVARDELRRREMELAEEMGLVEDDDGDAW